MLTINSSFLYSSKIGPNGLSEGEIDGYSEAYNTVNDNLKNSKYGFANIVKNTQTLEACKNVFSTFGWAKYMVVLGIGGSDLGTRMLQDSLGREDAPVKVLFGGDTTDPQQYHDISTYIEPDTTVVVVVSKSGSTIETACGYLYFKNYFQQRFGDEWSGHFIFVTDSKQGIMFEEGKRYSVPMLPVPDDVGGRFSVLSVVGLLPALGMGIDVNTLVSSANSYFELALQQDPQDNIAWQIALSQFVYQQKRGIGTVVLIPYLVRLELFGNWFRQLWAESLGKDGKGILPIKAVGPKDQHSQVQYYNQGKWLSTFLFIAAKKYAHDFNLTSKDDEALAYLDGKTLSEIVKAECLATRVSLAKNGRPSMFLEIAELNEQAVGELIAMFELSVVYLAQLLGVNAFDQPGVEAGKEYMYGLLGKRGFEEKAREIAEF